MIMYLLSFIAMGLLLLAVLIVGIFHDIEIKIKERSETDNPITEDYGNNSKESD